MAVEFLWPRKISTGRSNFDGSLVFSNRIVSTLLLFDELLLCDWSNKNKADTIQLEKTNEPMKNQRLRAKGEEREKL
jgi:hypothetical protein